MANISVLVEITVSDINTALGSGYDKIKVYRSLKKNSGFSEITTSDSRIDLQAGVSNYEYIDKVGTVDSWYKFSLFDSSTGTEDTLSAAMRGVPKDTNFSPITYPKESQLTLSDYKICEKVRNLIGDRKELTRDYVSQDTGYDNVSEDKYSYNLSNPPAWPLRVIMDGTEYTTADEPRVNDYQFLTFSGTQINTTSGTLDVWYYHFRFSDQEIISTYWSLSPPIGLTEEDVTFELKTICTAIELLERETRLFGATSASEVDIYQEIRINPKGGLAERWKDLDRLYQRKRSIEERIKMESSHDLSGVLID